jgi:hypothetical protein
MFLNLYILIILTVIPKVSLGEKNFVVQKRLLILSRSIASTGNNFSYHAAHFYTIADDKIAEHKAFRDDLSFMIQLGIIGAASPQYEPIINALKGMMNKPT